MKPGEWRDDVGQSLVEFALTVPVFLFTVIAAIQLALFVGQEFNVMQVTRETARWLAINPHTTDDGTLAYARSIQRPGMLSSSFVSVATSPACAALDGNGRCASRVNVQEISVRIQYDVSHMLFVPTQLQVGAAVVRLPTTLPAYTAWAPIE